MKEFRKVFRRNPRDHCKKLIIAVHGMGEQDRNQLASSVAGLIARGWVGRTLDSKQAVELPQGLWEGRSVAQPHKDDVIGFAPEEPVYKDLEELAFAEIYWADLPMAAADHGHRLQPAPLWARSVVDRLRQRHDLTKDYAESDLRLGATVVEEVAETLKILQNLLTVTKLAGVFNFDLGTIVGQYLGDVQQVADFRYLRDDFVQRFRQRIDHLAAQHPEAELHFVAHSEGSVLTLLTLLEALHVRTSMREKRHQLKQAAAPAPPKVTAATARPSWLAQVRTLTTLGSPIDKHLLLWPEMWGFLSNKEELVTDALKKELAARENLRKSRRPCVACDEARKTYHEAALVTAEIKIRQRQKWHALASPIRWRNYYDHADPVGYDLDTSRQKLDLWGCRAFSFKPQDDEGFRRYPMAGKAHVDYFSDEPLFQHILHHITGGKCGRGGKAGHTWLGRTSFIWPFVITGLLHVIAVIIFHKSIAADALSVLVEAAEKTGGKNAARAAGENGFVVWSGQFWGMLACGALLYGTTVWSRISAIGVKWDEHVRAVLWYLASVAVVFFMLPGSEDDAWKKTGLVGMLGASLAMVALGGIVRWWSRHSGAAPVWALRWQMILGGGALTVGMLKLYSNPHTPLLKASVGAAAFLFLWWLGMLLFDLCYVWKRYINTTQDRTFLGALRARTWTHQLDAVPLDAKSFIQAVRKELATTQDHYPLQAVLNAAARLNRAEDAPWAASVFATADEFEHHYEDMGEPCCHKAMRMQMLAALEPGRKFPAKDLDRPWHEWRGLQ